MAAAPNAQAASFDCSSAELKADEKAICENRDLNDADVRMVTTFDLVSQLLAMGSRGELQDAQVAWLTKRQACNADLQCLRDAYASRLDELKAVFAKIERPF
ncbi:hypothetical protein [Rhizobium sp. RU36D]|uniref:lysozyme inhibitor LprI family protein n=1 Tax=Rhizobium sp. RU36D TaxID=1907415 RepID=UPI001FCCD496|nr:hypothetical protein [Rhizobium sp. RU36D]